MTYIESIVWWVNSGSLEGQRTFRVEWKRKRALGLSLNLLFNSYDRIWVITITSYNRQRRRKRSSSCQTFLRNSITHQCLLFRCKTSSSRTILPRNSSRAVLWRNPARKPCWMVALRSYLSSGGLISAVVQRQSGPGPNSTGQGPCRGAEEGVGAKKCCDQACNDRQTQKNPRWMDSLLGEHLHKN